MNTVFVLIAGGWAATAVVGCSQPSRLRAIAGVTAMAAFAAAVILWGQQ